ncbi:tRNA-dihydrouridine(16/17) synthase [NAD(P)(+)]-like [Anopheles cruzii]|uniref:tRNA-dihydrouridine(16/17) synthase [NAD(P)(+)]-like n=1 Tax=Anopheles cruzii TaxID=68878 RepID=UPI0022EC76A0|nr:tRNA-dihydrouridine(16/17) synthase [NAD(P)(+)]-like [Anopheles cruzii]
MVTSDEGNAITPTEPSTGGHQQEQPPTTGSGHPNAPTTTAGRKLAGFEFYEHVLHAPRYVVAPMVDASELAWRLLSRRHGAQLCYSPMFHSSCFSKDPKYRKDSLQTCPEDRPLIIQFCGNDPKVMLEAALLAQDYCDAIDINLGCPQAIAKRGHYGAFLQEEWELLRAIVSTLHRNLAIPVTCKIRIFDDMAKTIRYARMLQDAGAQLLTVHGRTREQKGPLTGLADWKYVTVLRQHLTVPVFSNGNIMSVQDVERCIAGTGANGVMTAEGNLYNPALFEGINPLSWDMANEYLDLVEQYPAPVSFIRGHMFKLFHHLMHLKSNAPLREQLAVCRSVPEFRSVVLELEQKYRPYHDGQLQWNGEEQDEPAEEQQQKQEDLQEPPDCNLRLPPWLCQPYVRIPPEAHRQKLAEARRLAEDPTREKRQFFDVHGNEISRKRMKKMRRVQRRPKNRNRNDPKQSPKQSSENEDEEQAAQSQFTVSVSERDGRRRRRFDELCKNDTHCTNPMGLKCDHRLCKTCCKSKCYREDRDCPGHKIRIKSRRDRARALTLAEQQQKQQASGEQQMHDERDDSSGETEMDVKADAADLTTEKS